VLGIVRSLIPPHSDNEGAAEYLSKEIGDKEAKIEWVVVRPDNLIDAKVSKYKVISKPQGELFGGEAGVTTRSNVAHFMVDLVMNDETWNNWKFQMPVQLNDTSESNPQSGLSR